MQIDDGSSGGISHLLVVETVAVPYVQKARIKWFKNSTICHARQFGILPWLIARYAETHMRRGTAIAIVFIVVAFTVGNWGSVSLAAKGDGKCQDEGEVVVTDSVTYKCAKFEKKLRWVAEQSKSESSLVTVTTPTSPVNSFASWIAEVVAIVNTVRAASGLGPVSECSTLDKSALLHSQDMNSRDFFDHTNPDGKTPSDRIRLTGFYGKAKSRWTGENIAAGFTDATSVMAAWMKSPGHRANILNSKFSQLGVGIASTRADSLYSGYIWTQNFGAGGTC